MTLGPEGSTVRMHFRRPDRSPDGSSLPTGFYHEYTVELVRGIYGKSPPKKVQNADALPIQHLLPSIASQRARVHPTWSRSTSLTVWNAMQPSVAALLKQLEELKLQLAAAEEDTEKVRAAAQTENQALLAEIKTMQGVIDTAKAMQVTQMCKITIRCGDRAAALFATALFCILIRIRIRILLRICRANKFLDPQF